MKITIIGVGNMGSAIMKGLSRTQNFTLSAMNPVNSRVTSLAEKLGFKLVNTNSEVVNLTPDIVILTTPAPITTAVAKELAVLNDHTIFISAAAGITHADLAKVLPNKEIVNIIPNTPVEVNAGTIGLALPTGISAEAISKVMTVLDSLGDVIEVPERQLDIIGVIGGCGPAFVDVMMNLKERYPALTGDDVFFCVLSLLCCSKTVVMELMDATSDALKTRKNRIKNKMDAQIFERVFGVDNQ